VTWEDIIEDLCEQLCDPNAMFILDNFPPATLIFPEEAETNDYVHEIKNNFLQKVGLPYVTLQIDIDREVLEKRLFTSLELGEEDALTEEQLAPMHANLEQTADILASLALSGSTERPENPLDDITTWRVQSTYILPGNSPNERIIDGIFTTKIILSNFDNTEYDVYIKNLCINYNLAHVNVRDIVGEDADIQTAIQALKKQVPERLKFR
jgi:hypothetical protein